jgi:GTP 3',8-cyclase
LHNSGHKNVNSFSAFLFWLSSEAFKLTDIYNRTINYLRVSVTDRCNLRCKYCIPSEGVPLISHNEILRYEEIERIIKLLKDLGITKIRITGGEPLIRKGIISFLKRIENHNIHLTTNLTVENKIVEELNNVKLKSINISLDTLKNERYKFLTGKDLLNRVKSNLKIINFSNIKSNTVLLKGINDDEIIDIVNFGIKNKITVRFIEKMNWVKDGLEYVSNSAVKNKLIEAGYITDKKLLQTENVAVYYQIKGTKQRVGFISPITEKFCNNCNRLRLTSDGKMKLCLFDNKIYDIKEYIRSNYCDDKIKIILSNIIVNKPLEYKKILGNNMSFYGG